MALVFPDAPVTGDTYTPQDGNTYRYDGVKWIFATTSPLEPASLKLNDTGIDVTDTGANGNAVILADATTVGYFNSSGLTATDSLFALIDPTDHTKRMNFDLSSITAGATTTVVLTDASGELIVSTANQALTNKTFNNTTTITINDANLTLQDNVDITKQLNFQLSGITSNNIRTLTVPNANGQIIVNDAGKPETFSNATFANTTIVSVFDASLTIQNSANTTKQAQFDVPFGFIFSSPKIYSLPNGNTTLVGADLTQTLTLKTFSNDMFLIDTISFNDSALDKPKLLNHSVHAESLGTLTGTGTTNVSIANATYFTVTMTANARTFAFTNPPPSGHASTFFMEITNGGLATITWPLSVRWTQPAALSVTGTPPLLTPDGVDLLAFTTTDAGSNYRGSFAMKDSK